MPLFRTPDGKIVEEKTKKQSNASNPDADSNTEKVDVTEQHGHPPASGNNDFYDEKTRIISRTEKRPVQQSNDEEKTRLFGARRGRDEAADPSNSNQSDGMQDPVVGWLVVIDGPGRGKALALGYGANSIGRSEQDRVPLLFGDDQISRCKHAVVTFDPRGGKFYVQHGGGTNLTYLGNVPVLQPAALQDRDDINIGNTTLKFIALCGDNFEWSN